MGAQLAASWHLPDNVVAVVRNWANWSAAEERREACAIVHLAHDLAEHMAAGSEALAAAALPTDPAAAHLGLGPAQILALCAQCGHVHALVEGC